MSGAGKFLGIPYDRRRPTVLRVKLDVNLARIFTRH